MNEEKVTLEQKEEEIDKQREKGEENALSDSDKSITVVCGERIFISCKPY